VHIALLPASRLLTDIFAWQETRRGDDWPANLVLVSGPSKTADIEQTMSVGVHGPKQFMVLVYEQG
jgi:L-lactate dehydrogenase complex protein LldG